MDAEPRIHALAPEFDSWMHRMGVETSVTGLSTFGCRDVVAGVAPMFSAPTCKIADQMVMRGLMQKLVSPAAAQDELASYLRLWRFSTDGDPLRAYSHVKARFGRSADVLNAWIHSLATNISPLISTGGTASSVSAYFPFKRGLHLT